MEPILQECFPDEALAAKELGMVSQTADLMKILQNNAVTIKKRIDDALARRNEAQSQYNRQKTERETLFNKFSEADRLQFKGTFDMVQQQVLFLLFSFINLIIFSNMSIIIF